MRSLILTFVLAAQVASAQTTSHVLTPAQSMGARSISDLRISPDMAQVAFVVSEPPKGNERNRDVWVVTIATKEARRMTFSDASDSSPRWSPDGQTLAFLSSRDNRTQIYLLPMHGGDPLKLTEGRNSVRSFEWAPDGKRIAFIATEPTTDAEEKKSKEKDDARVVDRDDKHSRVWMVDVTTHQARQVTHDPWDVSDLRWTPRGDRLIVTATDKPASDQETQKILSLSPEDGTSTVVAAPRGPFGSVSISPDGGTIAFVGSRVDGPSPHDLYLQRLGESVARNVTGTTIDRPVGSITWQPDGSLLAVVQDGFRSRIYRAGVDRVLKPMVNEDKVNATTLSAAGQALVVFVGESTTVAPEIYLRQGGQDQQLTRINEGWAHPAAVKPEVLRYKSFDGLEIEAALLRPSTEAASAAQPKKGLPLVVLIHGGPTGRWSDSYEAWGQLLVARGYAVLYPNIRGSVGYGHKFIESNRADWGGGDFKDVMAGVDYVVKQGIADPDRIGIGGWSYGGYMSAWAITQTTRFKAAVVGAGLSDLASEFGTEAGPAYDEWFFGLPYEKLDGFIKCSPITFIKNAKTPTLILHGENDTTDPIGQGQQLYRGLKRYGVPTDFVIYPREGHGLREEKHLLDRLNRMIEWFDKYMKATT